jgi:RHS repeat-associated protein
LLPASDSGVQGDDITNVVSPTVRVPASAGQIVRLYVDGTLSSQVIATGPTNFTVGPLADGIHVVLATLEDVAGNQSVFSVPLVLTIDTAPPALPVFDLDALSDMRPYGHSTTNLSQIGFAGHTDPGALVTLTQTGFSTTADANGNFAFTRIDLPNLGQTTFTVTAANVAGNTSTFSRAITRTDAVETVLEKPAVSLHLSATTVNAGDTVTITVSVTDAAGVADTQLTIDGQPVALDANGQATFTPTVAGVFTVAATAHDSYGNEGDASQELQVFVPGSSTAPPVATFDDPSDTPTAMKPLAVTGTATSDNLLRYTLEYSPEGQNQWTRFASGTTSVADGPLGTFDPTLLVDGFYDVRLTVTDTAGNVATATKIFDAEGLAKVGNFTVSFNDLVVPGTGMPITLTRTYDSRTSTQSGDFGFGWSYSISQIKVSRSSVLGAQIIQTETPVANNGIEYGFVSTLNKFVNVTLPNGDVQKFVLGYVGVIYHSPPPLLGLGLGLGFSPPPPLPGPMSEVQLFYEPIDGTGTTAKLEAVADNTVNVSPPSLGPVRFLDRETGQVYNPTKWKLTTADGTVYLIDDTAGIQTITDANGNVLTFTPNAIQHSDGQAVNITRDSQGRITTITDPMGNKIQYGYDFYGDLTTVTDQAGNVTHYVYDSNHRLLQIQDPLGRQGNRNEYDASGRLIATIDGSGHRTDLSTDLAANQEKVIDPLGQSTIFTYNDQGQVTSETDPMGHTTLRTYDDNGLLLAETNPLGQVTKFTYDSNENMLTTTDPAGNVTSFTYNSHDQETSTTDPLGHTKTFGYDARGNLISVTDAMGYVTQYTYDLRGEVTSVTDALDHTTTLMYDSRGDVISTTDPLGHTTTFTYDALGHELSQTQTRTDGEGRQYTVVTSQTYDAKGRVLTVTDPGGGTQTNEWTANSQVAGIINRDGAQVSYQYDASGNQIGSQFSNGMSDSSTYDAAGRIISSTDRTGLTTQITYNADGQIVGQSVGGVLTTYGFDAAGQQTSQTDAEGNSTLLGYAIGNITYPNPGMNGQNPLLGLIQTVTTPDGLTGTNSYDAAGNLQTVTAQGQGVTPQTATVNYDADNRATSVAIPGTTASKSYNGAGEVTSVTDLNGGTTSFQYDAGEQLTDVTDAAGGHTHYTYDQLGNMLSQTDQLGNTTTWEYDNAGHVISRTLPGGQTEYFTYNVDGTEKSHTDFNGATTYHTYDSFGLMVSTIYPDGTSVVYGRDPKTGLITTVTDSRGVTHYQWDSSDRIIKATNPDGTYVGYVYDDRGNLYQLVTPYGTTTYTYDAADVLTTVTDPTGKVTTYSNNGVQTVVDPNGVTTVTRSDAQGRVLSIVSTDASGNVLSSYTYIYSANNSQMQVVSADGQTVTYGYDQGHRLISAVTTVGGAVTDSRSYTYDLAGNRLSQTINGQTTNYQYDADNRLVSAGQTQYTYDNNGNLISSNDGTGTTTYKYDYENRLVQVVSPSGAVTNYTYDFRGNRVSSSSGGQTVNYLVSANGALPNVVAEYDSQGNEIAYYTYGEQLISQSRGGTASYYLYDATGSTRQLVNAAGTVTDTYTYDPYGNLLNETGTTTNEFLFQGTQLDAFTGLYYMRARYMDPSKGTFLTKDDLIVIPGTAAPNPYSFAGGDPTSFADPSGHQILELAIFSLIINFLNIAAAAYGIQKTSERFKELFAVQPPSGFGVSLSGTFFKLGDIGTIAYGFGIGAKLDFDNLRWTGEYKHSLKFSIQMTASAWLGFFASIGLGPIWDVVADPTFRLFSSVTYKVGLSFTDPAFHAGHNGQIGGADAIGSFSSAVQIKILNRSAGYSVSYSKPNYTMFVGRSFGLRPPSPGFEIEFSADWAGPYPALGDKLNNMIAGNRVNGASLQVGFFTGLLVFLLGLPDAHPGPEGNSTHYTTTVGPNEANLPYRGDGYSVAVIDSGIDYTNPALAGHVILGPNFGDDNKDPMDLNGHGTRVAGLIVSGNAQASGIAPGADVIAIKVTTGATSDVSINAVQEALQWVIDNGQKYHIAAINLSVASGDVAKGQGDPTLEPLFEQLSQDGIFVSAAAGNMYSPSNPQEGVSVLAASPYVASVGAVWSANVGPASFSTGARDYSTGTDRIASFSQRGPGLDLLAPGGDILGLSLAGGLATESGTSEAAPLVAGAAVLVRQMADQYGLKMTPAQILALLQSTGTRIYDGADEDTNVPASHLWYSVLNVRGALDSLAQEVGAPALPDTQATAVTPAAAWWQGMTTQVLSESTLTTSDALTNWKILGTGSVVGDTLTLDKNLQVNTDLSDTMVVSPGTVQLQFLVTQAMLSAAPGQPPDAFEAAFLDPTTLNPLVTPVTGLSETDAFLNIQADGAVYFGPGVIVSGVSTSGQIIALDQPLVVTVDLTGVPSQASATLFYDLVGFGTVSSSVTVQNVRLLGSAPKITGLSGTTSLNLGDTTSVNVQFEANVLNSYTAEVDWGDGTTTTLTLPAGQLTFNSTHVYGDEGDYTTKVTIIGTNGSDSGTLGVMVNNVGPTASAGQNVTVVEGQPATLHGTYTDPSTTDGHTFLWQVVSSNGQVVPNATTQDFSFTPIDDGAYTVTFTVSDDDGGSSSSTITVTATGLPPAVAINGAPASSPEGTTIALTSTVTNASPMDTAGFTYTWSVTKDGNPFASSSTSGFTFTPDDEGTYAVTLTATNEDGTAASASATIDVTNLPPAVTINGAPTSSPEGTAITLTSTVTDPSTVDMLAGFSYAWSVTKNGSAFASGNTSGLNFTPDNAGSYVVILTATDEDGIQGSTSATITITPVAPAVAITGAPASIPEGTPIVLGSTVSDGVDPTADGPYTYAWTVTRNGSSFDSGSASTFGFIPSDNGSYVVMLTATDKDGLQGTVTTTITVTPVAPTAAITGAPASSPEGTAITLGSTVSDGVDPVSDGPYTYAWTVTRNGNPFTSGTSASLTFTPNDDGSYVVSLMTTDKDGLQAAASATITVTLVVPVATITGSPGSSPEGTAITLGSTVNDGVDAAADGPYTYAWTVTSNGASFASGTSSSLNFTPTDDGSYVVLLTSTDNEGLKGTTTSTITVTPIAPTAAITGAPTSSPYTYAWTVTRNGTAFASGSTSSLSFTPNDDGSYVVSLTATDNEGLKGTASSTITVTPVAPTATITGAPASSPEGTAITLGSTVSDGVDVAADSPYSYAWTVTKNGTAFASGSSSSMSFTPNDDGSYVVSLTATDNEGLKGSASNAITVTPIAPTATITGAPTSSPEGTAITVGSTANDGVDAAADGPYSYAWTVTKNGTAFTSSSGSSDFTFTPNDEGTYVVTMTATDKDGNVGSANSTITGTNVAPSNVTASFSTQIIDAGSTPTLAGNFTDPGSGDTHTMAIHWADGSADTTLNLAAGALTFSTTHQYVTNPSGSITVTVTDDDGGTASYSFSIGSSVAASVYVLNSSVSGALTLSGNAVIQVPGLVEVDSTSTSALSASGNASIQAGGIQVAGGTQSSGNVKFVVNGQTVSSSTFPHASLPDPFANLPVPSVSFSTPLPSVNISSHTSLNINPGVYSQIRVSGNASLTMNPGTYVIAGGGFSVSGNGSVNGSCVTIYNAGSSYPSPGGSFGAISLSGNGTMTLTAPTSDTYDGVVIFQARDNTQAISMSGNNLTGVVGSVYAKSAQLNLSGNAKFNDALVVGTMNISGNAVFSAITTDGTTVYTPAQIRSAYAINSLTLDGTGQTVAIVDAYDNPAIYQSVDLFDQQMGLTDIVPTLYGQFGAATSFLTVLNQDGQTTSLPATDPVGAGTSNWEAESALDVEWTHAMAPGAQIVLVEASSQSLADLMAAVQTAAGLPGVSVVSMSWGYAESQAGVAQDEALYDDYLTTPAGHTGVTFVASTGDNGSAAPEYPALSPNVIAVGGTSLMLNADGSYSSETGWGAFNSAVGQFIGSGGGVSQFENEPAFQQGVQSTGNRSIPDVSFVADPNTGVWIADPYNLSESNPWEVAGGTSLSAPAWAGLIALVDQGRAAAGQQTLGSAGPTEAQTALYNLPQSDFNVIASGTNGDFTAQAGYNLVTGLGTPAANLVPDLIAWNGTLNTSGNTVPAWQGSSAYQQNGSGSDGGSGPADSAIVLHVFDFQAIGLGENSATRTVTSTNVTPATGQMGQSIPAESNVKATAVPFSPPALATRNFQIVTTAAGMLEPVSMASWVGSLSSKEAVAFSSQSRASDFGVFQSGSLLRESTSPNDLWQSIVRETTSREGEDSLDARTPGLDGDTSVLIGGAGNDLLIGGQGQNLMVGGFGFERVTEQQAETSRRLVEQSAVAREESLYDESGSDVEVVDQLFSEAGLDLSELFAGGES